MPRSFLFGGCAIRSRLRYRLPWVTYGYDAIF